MDWTLAASLRTISPSALPNLTRAETVAETLLAETGYADAEVSILLTDDRSIHALNKQWRGYDKPTDVLSWPLEEGIRGLGIGSSENALAPDSHSGTLLPIPNSLTPVALGDVAISLDTATRQAAARGWAVEEEIALLLIHGILHLLGYEDETESGAEAMRVIERRLLGKPLEKVTD